VIKQADYHLWLFVLMKIIRHLNIDIAKKSLVKNEDIYFDLIDLVFLLETVETMKEKMFDVD
jgi:hypothetical protein